MRPVRSAIWLLSVAICFVVSQAGHGWSSTYVAYIPLDSPIYQELDTLNGLGYLKTYLDEIKPISRIEAARLVLEAEDNLAANERPDSLAQELIGELRAELSEEIRWMDNGEEDGLPTMIHPLSRIEAQYIYSRGDLRTWQSADPKSGIHAVEGTPLLANDNGIPTQPGSNEVVRYSGWAGAGGMMTVYGEAAVAGPITRSASDTSRFRALGTGAVLSLGDTAISFGEEEMRWGIGSSGALSQGDNADPFPALRIRNIHPKLLPGFLRYLGQCSYEMFLGQLGSDRYFSRPWIDGQIISFKPLPNFEIGLTHAIMFGGMHNDNYSAMGFAARAIGISTGNPLGANTNSRAGVYFKFRFPRLRGLEFYQEILGEDNLTSEVAPVGRVLPFLSVSYQGGVYLPRLTSDGRSDIRLEYTELEPNYSAHDDSLYWENNGLLMGYPLGPNGTEIEVTVGRWLRGVGKAEMELSYVERAPSIAEHIAYPASIYGSNQSKERGFGGGFSLLHMPANHNGAIPAAYYKTRLYMEVVNHMNFAPAGNLRAMFSLTIGLTPNWKSLKWQ